MQDVVTTFPLLNLPIDAILNTIRTMDYQEIFGISILSKKTKSLVESVKLKHRRVEIDITDSFKITIFFSDHTVLVFQLYQVQENAPLQELETPETYHIQCGITTVTWKNSMSVKELLEHLRLIFHSSIDPLFFKENCERFSLESIHKNVTDVRMVAISSENREHNKKILNLFQPDSLEIGGQALGRVPRDVLIQNFDQIRVSSGQTTLDDLLMTNSRLIHLSCRGLSWKILNKFLRLWTTGCNSRLEFLFVEFDGSSRFNDLFDGLKFQAAPSGRVRSFKSTSWDRSVEVTKGRDISRFDGTQATVAAHRIFETFTCFYMVVWHDHCAVSSI